MLTLDLTNSPEQLQNLKASRKILYMVYVKNKSENQYIRYYPVFILYLATTPFLFTNY